MIGNIWSGSWQPPSCCEVLFSGWLEEMGERESPSFEDGRAPGVSRQRCKGGTKQGVPERGHWCICLSSLPWSNFLHRPLHSFHLLTEPSLALLGPAVSLSSPHPARQPRLGRSLPLRLGWCPQPSLCCTCIPDATSGAPWSFPALGLEQRRLTGTQREDLAFSTQGVHTPHLAGSLEVRARLSQERRLRDWGLHSWVHLVFPGGLGEKKPQICR